MSCQEKGLTEKQVENGCKRAKAFNGNLKLGDFIKLCQEFKQHPSHKQFTAIEHKSDGPEVARKHLDDLFRACPELCPERHRERLGI